jgi:predicted outer membrane lipoprotein
MQGRSKTVSVPLVPFAPARRWHWPSLLTLLVSVLINVLWIVLFACAIGVAVDLWLEHSDKLPRMLWRATRI